MAYQLRYNLEFKNQADSTCLLEIYEDRTGDPLDEIDLVGSSKPIIMRSIDNDRRINTPIRGHELVAEIVSDTIGITDFIADNDLTWKGVFKVDGNTVFTGFLVQEDSQEDYVTYAHVIRLRFTDGLALLKGVPLSDTAGLPWHATPTVYEIVRVCLLKTGNELPIRVRCNIFPSDTADVTATAAMKISKLYTRSFMKDQREFDDCYKVLADIMLSWGCTLYQYRGEWVIDRWADKIEQSTAHFSYDVGGTPTYIGTTLDTAAIGETEGIKEVEVPLLLSIGRAAREARISYRFEKWPELIRNLDLDEGANVVLLSDSTQRTYDLDYFTKISRVAYSRREIDTLGTETDRYLFINGDTNNLDFDKYVKPEAFPASKDDRLRISFSACSKNDLPGTAAIVYVKCGSLYLDDDGTWNTGATFLRLDFASADDSTKWKTYEIETDPIPVDGDVEMRLLLMQGCNTGNETRYKGLRIDYINAVGLSISAKGDYNRYTNPVTTKNPSDEQVTVSDGRRKTDKGALLKSSGAVESGWQRGANVETLRFSQLNALGYYQHTYRSKLIFEGTFLGSTFTVSAFEYPVGFWPVYELIGKQFALTSLDEFDWLRCTWRGTLVEIYDETLDADVSTQPSTYDYNFIFD